MQRRSLMLAVLAAAAVACGNDSGAAQMVDAPAASADAPPLGSDAFVIGPPQHNVTLSTLQPPDFIAFRDGSDGLWQVPGFGSDGYTLLVDDDYIVVMVCDNHGSGSAFDAEEFGFTYAVDGPAISATCIQPAPAGGSASAGQLVTITGTMAQAGSVQIGEVGSASATPGWTYQITTIAGTHDVLAIDTANNAVFDPDQVLEPGSGSSTPGPAIDTATDGQPLVAQALTITGLGSSTLAVEDELFATDVSVVSQGIAAVALSMPLGELGSDDTQLFSMTAADAVGTRGASADVLGAAMPPASYELLPDFTTATFALTSTAATATWTALPVATFDQLSLSVVATNGLGRQNLTVSSSWVAARAATQLAFDASEPEYLSQWLVDAQDAIVTVTEGVEDLATGIDYTTAVSPPP